MVLIMVTSIFPSEKGREVQKKYYEIQKKFLLPSFINLKKVALRWIRDGIKAVAIYDVKSEKVSDALNFVYRYELQFSGIKGYTNEIETLLTVEEMPSLGIS